MDLARFACTTSAQSVSLPHRSFKFNGSGLVSTNAEAADFTAVPGINIENGRVSADAGAL